MYSKGLIYEYDNSTGTCKITGIGQCKDLIIKVPAKINGVPVTTIASGAFSANTFIGVELAEGITTIASGAFSSKTLLQLTLPDSLTSISWGAIRCPNICELINNSTIEIRQTDLENPNSGGENQQLILNNSVVITTGTAKELIYCDNWVFYDAIDKLGNKVFYLTKYLGTDKMLSLPQEFKVNGEIQNNYLVFPSTFCECSELTELTFTDAALLDQEVFSQYFSNCKNLHKVRLPQTLTFIPKHAFEGTNLTSVEIPNSITSIDWYAFEYCYKLVEVINRSNLDINKGSHSLSALEVHNGESKIINKDGYLFYTVDGVNCLVNYIGTDTELTLPSNYNGENYIINDYAFSHCYNLTSVTIPNSVTSIGSRAFEGCRSLTSITLPFVGATKDGTSDTHFGYIFGASSYSDNYYYVPSSLKTVIITGGTSIGSFAFSHCYNLTSIEIPNSVTSIGEGAFEYCDSLTSIEIPNSVTSIGDRAFYSCDRLMSVTFTEDITKQLSLGYNAFSYCTNLVNVNIPATLKNLDGYTKLYGARCFDNEIFWTDKVLYIEDCLVAAKSSISGTCYIKEGIRIIASGAFRYCNLTNVIIPNSVTSIESSAFNGCSDLVSVKIPDSVTNIGDFAFSSCWSLTKIIIGSGVTYIGLQAFTKNASTVVILSPNNTSYQIKDDCLIEIQSGKVLLKDLITEQLDTTSNTYWENGCQYQDTCLVAVDTSFGHIKIKEGTTSVASNALNLSLNHSLIIELPESLTDLGTGIQIHNNCETNDSYYKPSIGIAIYSRALTPPQLEQLTLTAWWHRQWHSYDNTVSEYQVTFLSIYVSEESLSDYQADPIWSSCTQYNTNIDTIEAYNASTTVDFIKFSQTSEPQEVSADFIAFLIKHTSQTDNLIV